jgi:type I restriction enzyme S subunit
MKETNKVFLIDCDSEDLIVSTGFLTLKPKDGFDGRYIYHYFRSKIFQRLKDRYCSGATQKAINNNSFKKLKVPRCEIEQQKKIVQILDTADSLRQKRKEQLALLDDYLKSVFLEMFGDPRSDSRWNLVDFGDVIDVLTDYHANGSYEVLRKHVKLKSLPDYALMVRTTDLENRNFTDDVKYISKEAYNFLEKSKIYGEEIIINKYGEEIIINKIGSAGNVYLMPNLNRPVSLGMNAFLLRFKKITNNIFIFYLLSSDYGKSIIKSKVKGAVTKTIRKDAVRSLKIPLPPLELQIQFVSIVKQIEKTKQKMRVSLDEMDNHFNALMQKYFG